ncbi:hypothetical protein HAX54_024254 [Datura stramonium]|uniref:Uncharacterized protein n=1 Tax=Datura stramonium TaxID=4076 RepID=A0ABS8UXZ4_DATST|nr:hypothetical protein [Datura stramonium]
MAPKVNKGKGFASSSQGSKRARKPSEEDHENVNMAPPPLRVGPGYKEPLDDDIAMENEMTRVNSDIESSDDDEEDSEMGQAALVPTGIKE